MNDLSRSLVLDVLADGDAVDHGGPVRTPLHHAVAAGDLAGVKLLVEGGADLTAVDPTYGATPLGWAALFDQPEVAEYLRSL